MPWSQTSSMDQKTQFIADYMRHTLRISELCAHYRISRKTGYKWIDRYLHDGPQGLKDRSTNTAPNRTPEHIVQALLELRIHHPTWGAGKLLAGVQRRHPGWYLPARSTACEILKRNGLVASKRRRRRIRHPGRADFADSGRQRLSVRRRQGAIQDRRRPVLLSTHGH